VHLDGYIAITDAVSIATGSSIDRKMNKQFAKHRFFCQFLRVIMNLRHTIMTNTSKN